MRGRVRLTLAIGRSVLRACPRSYRAVISARSGLEILDPSQCRPYDRLAEKPCRPGFPMGSREGVTNVSSHFQLPRGHRFLDRGVGPIPHSAGHSRCGRSQRHLPVIRPVPRRSMWSATSRTRFLSTDNPKVNQGRAAIGNQRRRGLTRLRIERPGLDRQTKSLQLPLEMGRTLE